MVAFNLGRIVKENENIDKRFFEFCKKAKTPTTKRQLKKWKRGKGLARQIWRQEILN